MTSITVSTENKSKIEVHLFQEKLLAINTETWIYSGHKDKEGKDAYHLFSREEIQFHGDLDALGLLAQKILDAVSPNVVVKRA